MNAIGRRLALIEKEAAKRSGPPRRCLRIMGEIDDIRAMLAAQGIDADDVSIVHRVIVDPDGTIGDQGPAAIL